MSATEELRVWLGNISARAAGSSVLIVGTYLDKVSEAVSRQIINVPKYVFVVGCLQTATLTYSSTNSSTIS